MSSIPREEIKNRLALLQKLMIKEGFEAACLVQTTDVYYFAGTGQDCHLYIPAEGKPLLLVYRDFERACQETPLTDVLPFPGLSSLPQILQERGYPLPKYLGMELDILPAAVLPRYQKLFPGSIIKDITPLILNLRRVKSSWELGRLRRAADLHARVFELVGDYIRPGRTELEIAAEFEAHARRLGHTALIRFRGLEPGMPLGLVMAGPSGSVPSCYPLPLTGYGLSPAFPAGPSCREIKEGEPVLIDYAGCYGDYIVDQTRLFSIGNLPPILQKAQEVALAIAAEVAAAARPGTTCGELYDLAYRLAKRAGLEENFMGWRMPAKFIGHGVGLELNEKPVLARGSEEVLAADMVFALEPKFTFPGLGAVGVEETYVVQDDGAVALTH
ncbi:MAG: hypothetical protein PWP65_1556 [Clostridia bacterium]|nr:hypothetical protein [Clostridia bacterium]